MSVPYDNRVNKMIAATPPIKNRYTDIDLSLLRHGIQKNIDVIEMFLFGCSYYLEC